MVKRAIIYLTPLVLMVTLFLMFLRLGFSLDLNLFITLTIVVIARFYLGGKLPIKYEIEEMSKFDYNQLHDLCNEQISQIEKHGFKYGDRFVLITNEVYTQIIVYVNEMHHSAFGISSSNSGYSAKFGIISFFSDSGLLITTDSKLEGYTPFIAERYLQIFVGADVETLIRNHFRSISFLNKKGYSNNTIDMSSFRKRLLECEIKLSGSYGKYKILKVIFFWITRKYQDYTSLIENQKVSIMP